MSTRIEALEKENQQLKADLSKIQNLSKQKKKRSINALKFVGGAIAGRKLKTSIYNILEEYNSKKNISKENFSDFLASLIQRITRIGVMTILFALLPSILLMRQNMLLKQQNYKIQDQTFLAEASRRSAQMFIMSDVLSDINQELDYEKRRTLTNTLTGRVVSLSKAMKPYRYIINGKLIEKPISPERGQLLITLSKSKMDTRYYVDEILQQSNFTQAELIGSNLYNAMLKEINLTKANLLNSNLVNANLSEAILIEANLTNVDLTDANLTKANLTKANLSNADLSYVKLSGANLTDVELNNAKVHRMDWINYITNTLKLKGAKAIKNNYRIDSLYFADAKAKVPTLIKK